MNATAAYRSPPGYPLFYVEERWRIECSGCGNVHHLSILLTHERYGSVGSKGRKTFFGEKIYNLPVHAQSIEMTTARCERCLDILPKESVPVLPPLRSPIGRSERMKRDALSAEVKQAKTLDDFDFS